MFGCGPNLATFAPLWSAKTAARQACIGILWLELGSIIGSPG